MKYFLVVDAGTGSGRVVVFDEVGHQMGFAQREWRHLNLTGVPGAIDFDVNKNWGIIKDLIAEAITQSNIKPEEIEAITSTSMREGLVLYDKEGREIWACSNIDARAREEVSLLKQQGLEQEIYERTGQTFSISDVPRLLWIKRNLPQIYEAINSLGMISDWVIYKLCGELHVEPSNVSTSGFFDTMRRKWSAELMETLGLPSHILPEVVEPGTVVGTLKKELAEELGIPSKIKVIMGGGDAQLATIGVGAVKEHDTVIIGGTFWQQEVNVTTPIPHPQGKIRINAHAVPDLWQFEGISFLIGLVMRWFRDAFCHREKKMAQELGISTYAILSEQSRNIPPGAYGIIPIFSNLMDYMQWRHAAPSLLNFDINDPERYGKPAIFRALMENAGFNSLGNLKEITRAVGVFPQEIIFAGGASYSPEWCKIMASIIGTRIKVPRIKEATALGAMICASIGSGLYTSFREATDRIVRFESIFEPDPEEHQAYLELYEKWTEVYEVMLELSDKGLLNHMWKAPGL